MKIYMRMLENFIVICENYKFEAKKYTKNKFSIKIN